MNARIFHFELWGTQEAKYAALSERDVASTEWAELNPQSPFYLFTPQDTTLATEYDAGWKVTDVFPVNSVGVVTARDALTIRWSPEEMWRIVRDFVKLPEHEAREKYNLGEDAQDWKVAQAQQDVRKPGPKRENVHHILYRPFDTRFTYYTGQARGFICRPRSQVMRHMRQEQSIGIHLCRQIVSESWRHVLATNRITDDCYVSNKTRERGYTLPLYLYRDPDRNGELFANGTDRHVNLNPDFLKEMENQLRLSFVVDGTGQPKKTFGPEDVFHYIYAIFHSPAYRERYAEFLKIDFPRVPLTADTKLFRTLCSRGKERVALHLMNSPKLARPITRYPVPGDNLVAKGHPRYVAPGEPEPETGKHLENGRVYISPDSPKSGTNGQYREGVPPEVWKFHVGGYQVCTKWLKDRRGRKLSYDDLTHYQKVVVALKETIRLMQEIDAAIPDWPIR